MTGWTVHRKTSGLAGSKNGITLYQGKDKIFLDMNECFQLQSTIKHSRRNYWKEDLCQECDLKEAVCECLECGMLLCGFCFNESHERDCNHNTKNKVAMKV